MIYGLEGNRDLRGALSDCARRGHVPADKRAESGTRRTGSYLGLGFLDVAQRDFAAAGSRRRTTGGSREEGLSAQQVKLLSACTQSLAQLGSQPGVLDAVAEDANAACGEIEFALSVDAKYGSSARATTWYHLRRAESLLAVAKTNLRKLTASASDS